MFICFSKRYTNLELEKQPKTQMIQLGTNKTKPFVREMWQIVFQDSDELLDIYFTQKYKNENTLISFVDNQPAASLQMWEYTFSFYGTKIPCYYLAGLCTYEKYRRQGLMAELIEKAHQIMKERGICLSILIPADEYLFYYYEQFGYAQVFFKGGEPMALKRLIQKQDSLEQSFETFNKMYNNSDFTVLKDFHQFTTIVEEQRVLGFEKKQNVDGIARIINLEKLLKIFAEHNPTKRFTVKITGDKHIEENNTYYTIEDGTVSKFKYAIADFTLSITEICELLMGHHKEEFENKIVSKFPKKTPIMNLMLE